MNQQVRSSANNTLAGLIASQRPGHALQAAFYRDREIHEQDIQCIFMRCWLYAGHVSQIADPGDFFIFELGEESIIIVRDQQGDINALVNVCRHRGSRVCLEPCGKVKTFVCRYHGWTYGLGGELRSRRAMPEDFDRSEYGLKRIRVQVFHGLIFINFAGQPLDFEAATARLDPYIAPFQLGRTKVAERRNYAVDANWKLALENYLECYHCAPAHPEYARIHTRASRSSDIPVSENELFEYSPNDQLSRETIDHSGMDATPWGSDIFYQRLPLDPGYWTGSEDGEPLAPLLGELKDYDGGATDVGIGPLTYLLIYSDYALVYRFIPRAPQATDMEVSWLVHEDAKEGEDYDREQLLWLWQVTSDADERIIRNNQLGVNSRFYEPGPFSEMESHTNKFVEWYLHSISS